MGKIRRKNLAVTVVAFLFFFLDVACSFRKCKGQYWEILSTQLVISLLQKEA